MNYASTKEIQKCLNRIKKAVRSKQLRLSLNKPETYEHTKKILGEITDEQVLSFINDITVNDYKSGPSNYINTKTDKKIGHYWEFKKPIKGKYIYIKILFPLKRPSLVSVKSFHI